MAEQEHEPNRRLRFSLRTLMLVTTFVAMIVSLFVMGRNNRRLTAENRRLRDEVGELSIEDESQLHAIRIPSNDRLEWAWRVWIPEGRQYRVRYAFGTIPKKGWPSGHAGKPMRHEPREQVIRYVIRRDPKDDRFKGSLSIRGASTYGHAQPWVEWPRLESSSSGVDTSTCVYPADQTVELWRHRVSPGDQSDELDAPTPGFLIWLEPVR